MAKACRVQKNDSGDITRVNKLNGQESKLYTTIAKHPLVKSTEEAYNAYKNIFSKKIGIFQAKTPQIVKGNNLFNTPLEGVQDIVKEYALISGITATDVTGITTINKGRAKKISDLFDEMENNPSDPETQASYEAMIEETIAQYELIQSKGYTVEINNEEPYSSSKDMIEDLKSNKTMKIFSTESAFGEKGITTEIRENNPLLKTTKFKDINGEPLLVNDLFRFVHDFFGHSKLGNGFGAIGEENAWNVHSRMYSPLARRAMTTETRGQNSWVNFSGVNKEAFKLRNKVRQLRKEGKTEEAQALVGEVYDKMKFAEQKIGLLPEWVSDPDFEIASGSEVWRDMTPEQQANYLGYELNKEGSKIVDGEGAFKYGKSTEVSVDKVVDKSLMNAAELSILEYWGDKTIRMFGGRGQGEGLAFYNRDTQEIAININNTMGGIVLSNQVEVNNAILHEIIHHILRNEVSNEAKFNEELEALKSDIISNKHLASSYVKNIIGYIEKGSLEEIITYSMTNRPFAEFLDSIESEETNEGVKTIWDKFIELLLSTLKSHTLLNSVRNVVSKYTETFTRISDAPIETFNYTENDVEVATVDKYKKAEEAALLAMKASGNKLYLQYDSPSREYLKEIVSNGGKLFVTKDGKSGAFVTEDGYMGGLFKNPTSNKNQAAKVLQQVRLEEGGNYFDSYATKLEEIYVRNGFKPVARLKFDENKAHKGWDDEGSPLRNKPDVVIFIYEPGVENKVGEGTYFETFEEAVAFAKDNMTEVFPEDKIAFSHRLQDGKIVTSFKEALKITKEGDVMELGLEIKGKFFPLITIKRNTNKNTEQGYVNNLILNGILSENRTKVGTEYLYESAGENTLQKVVNAELLREEAIAYLGSEGVTKDGFTFKLSNSKDQRKVINNSGEIESRSNKEIDAMSYEELQEETDNALEIVTDREIEAARQAYRDESPNPKEGVATVDEKKLEQKLLGFLSKLGVKTMSISNYIKNYKIRHGVHPSAKALADIANQVVAYTQGDTTSLSEEVAHFINEALPRDQVNNVLRNIHKTAEYAEFSEYYREIYKDEYPADQLEDVVRSEVLGKIVAKIVSKQDTSNKSEVELNIFEKVAEIVRDFFASITNRMRPEYYSELEAYLNDVETLLSTEDITDLVNIDNFEHSTLRLYNTGTGTSADKLKNKATLMAKTLQDTEASLLSSGTGSRSGIAILQKVQEDLKTGLELSSIMSLVSMLNNNVKKLNAALKDSEAKGKSYFFSSEENVVYHTTKGVAGKALGEVQVLLENIKKEEKTNKWDAALQEIEVTLSGITTLEAKATIVDTANVQRLVDKVMNKYGVSDESRHMVEKWINKAESDTNLFHSTFGQLLHAKDGMLNLAGTIIKNMRSDAATNHYYHTKEFQETLKDLDISEEDLSKLFVDGQFILSEWDFNEFENDVNNIYVSTFKQVMKESIISLSKGRSTNSVEDNEKLTIFEELVNKTTKELITLKQQSELPTLSLKETTKRKNLERPLLAPLVERTMIDSYYDDYELKLRTANVSDTTKQKLSNILGDISALKKKSFRKEGNVTIIDYNSLSESDKMTLSDLHKRRKELKSYTDGEGLLKPGLIYKHTNRVLDRDEKNQLIVEVGDATQLTEASIAALDLQKLDALNGVGEGKQEASLFYETIEKIDAEEGREAAIKFLNANAYTALSKNFWNNLDKNNSLLAALNKKAEEEPTLASDIKLLIYNMEISNHQIKSILKIHGRKNNPSEISAEIMNKDSRQAVKALTKELTDFRREARRLTGDMEINKDDTILTGVSEVNEGYKKELRGLDIFEDLNDSEEESFDKMQKEVEFAKDHMSVENANTVENARLSILKFLSQQSTSVDKSVERILAELGYSEEDLHDKKVHSEVIRYIMRRRLLPYYKRFTSESYNSFEEGLLTAPSLSNYLQHSNNVKEAFVEISPNPSFFDVQENDKLNPNKLKTFRGGYIQPKLSMYKNKKFEEMFGEITTLSDGTKTSSKNKKQYQAYEAMLVYRDAQMDANNVGETYNRYLLPQTRKTEVERVASFLKGDVGKNFKNSIKDMFNYTEDDMAQGEQMFGDDIKVIPKMYVNRLENPEDVSTDLFYSLTLASSESFLRQSRVAYYGDLMSIHDRILSRDMTGKDSKSSNTYKMIKSAIDFNLFGVKETATYPVQVPLIGTVDLVKVARGLLGFIKFKNLGLNVIIPITSLLTGEATRRIEIFVGEFIDKRSQSMGTKEYRRLVGDGMKEIGKINTSAKLNVLGEFYRVFDMGDSFKNSKYGFMGRNMPRTGMILHTGANYPLYGKTMLGILHDFRIVDGKMMNKNDFVQERKNQGVGYKDSIKEWEAAEDKVLYNYIVHKGNKITYNKEKLIKDLSNNGVDYSEQELDEIIVDIHNGTQKYISYVNSITDGQIPEEDKVLAQRHFLLSYFMTHRGWLSIGTARRFKGRHLNLDTNLQEEGSYLTLWNYMSDIVKEWDVKNMSSFFKSFSNTWDNSDELERRNMRRIAIEMGALASLMLLSVALRTAADDDDNEDIYSLQMANYLTYRTLNELSSVQFNIGSNVYETIDSPFVGMSIVSNMFSIGEVFDGDEVKHGSYRGMTKRSRYITKMVPGMKQYFDLQDMHRTYNTYKFYNQKNFNLTPVYGLWNRTVDKKD